MTQRVSPLRLGYLAMAWLTVAAILFQVFLVGLSLLGGRPSWETHIGLGHTIGLFPLVGLVLAFAGRLPGTDKWLNGLFIGVYIFQAEVFAAIRDAVPLYAAFHPVLALVLFSTSVLIAYRAWGLLSVPSPATAESGRALQTGLGEQLGDTRR